MLEFKTGKSFEQIFDVVIGSEIAKQLKYNIGDKIVLSHGIHKQSLQQHDEYPFQIVGILKTTGTPVDEPYIYDWKEWSCWMANGVQVLK